jgi:alginate O-acetyltransferase complex protein AlgI
VPPLLSTALAFLLVLAGWVFFRSATLPDALTFFKRLCDLPSIALAGTNPDLTWPDVISRRAFAALALAGIAAFIPDTLWIRWGWDAVLPATRSQAILRIVLGASFLILASAALASQSYNPFIYFRF